MESRKMVLMNLFSGQQWRDIENRPKDTEGVEEKEVETHGDSDMEIYNTMCKIDNQWKFAVWLKELTQGLYDNLKRWDGEGDGREALEDRYMVPMADSCWRMAKKPQNSVK